jgi:hypothetical protein
VTRTTIKPQTKGLFRAVMDSAGMPVLTDEVELGALWSAIPDLADTPLPENRWPSALFVWPREYHQTGANVLHMAATSKASIVVDPEVLERIRSDKNPDRAWLRFFSDYPAARGLTLDSPPHSRPAAYQTPRGWGIAVGFTDETEDEYVRAAARAPEHRFQRQHWLVPHVGKGSDPLSPLGLWWVLLFGFSLLARYEPTAWGASLDPDASELTVPLEDALDEALIAVPHLLLNALLNEPVLLPAPL